MIADISDAVPLDNNFAPCEQQWPRCEGNFLLPLRWFRNGVTWLALTVIVVTVFAEGTGKVIGSPATGASVSGGNTSEPMLRPKIKLNIDGKWRRHSVLAASPGNWLDGCKYFVSSGIGPRGRPLLFLWDANNGSLLQSLTVPIAPNLWRMCAPEPGGVFWCNRKMYLLAGPGNTSSCSSTRFDLMDWQIRGRTLPLTRRPNSIIRAKVASAWPRFYWAVKPRKADWIAVVPGQLIHKRIVKQKTSGAHILHPMFPPRMTATSYRITRHGSAPIVFLDLQDGRPLAKSSPLLVGATAAFTSLRGRLLAWIAGGEAFLLPTSNSFHRRNVSDATAGKTMGRIHLGPLRRIGIPGMSFRTGAFGFKAKTLVLVTSTKLFSQQVRLLKISVASGKVIWNHLIGTGVAIAAPGLSPDGRILALPLQGLTPQRRPLATVYIINPSDGRILSHKSLPDVVESVHFAKGESELAAQCWERVYLVTIAGTKIRN